MENLPQDCGLTVQEIEEIRQFIQKYPEVHTAKVFGSRALGTYKEASDVDIAIFGDGVTDKTARDLKFDLEEESYLPYFFDVISYNDITVPSLKEHIDRHGVTIYRKGWREVKLGEIVDINPENYSSKDEWKYINYLDTSNLTEGKIDYIQKLRPGVDKIPSRAKRKVRINDVLISTVRPNQKHYGIMKKVYDNMLVSTGFAVLRPKENVVNPYFLYAYISQNDITEYLSNVAEDSTTAYPSITPNVIADLDIFLPPLSEQKAIAEILGSLDDKIELLHRQNKTLEAIAETVFRKWFVEKASDEWEEGKLGDYITVKGGTTPSTTVMEYWDGMYAWATPKDLSKLDSPMLLNTERRITEKGLAQISSGLLPINTVLLSSRAPIGYVAINKVPVAINQGFIAIVCDKLFTTYFMYCWIKRNMELMVGAANGSTFLEISKSVFKDIAVLVPDEKTIKEFDKLVEPIFDKIFLNTQQIHSLEKLRDALLPKLISGEVKVLN